jgi:hypothetical protein
MPKYDVTATVTISTEIEPSGYLDEPHDDQFEDFATESFTGYGSQIDDSCKVTFVFVTDTTDTDEAGEEAQQALSDQLSYSGDDIEWEISDIEIESIEQQSMSVPEAVEVVRTFIDSREEAFRSHHPNVIEALELLLQQF